MRIEIWYNNGLFRAYPYVDKSSIEKIGEELTFKFGPLTKHDAYINLKNVNFIEKIPDED